MQRFGLGDVIFSMSAIRSLGDKILWPVMPYYVEGCNRAYPDITFIDYNLMNIDWMNKSEVQIADGVILPLAWQDTPLRNCMKLKYDFFGLPWNNWKANAMWTRDRWKERELFEKLDIKGPFNLISSRYGNDVRGNNPSPHSIMFPLPTNGLPNVHMSMISGFSLFDWAEVIEEATEIHAVSSSIIYLLELLELNAKKIHIHIRKPFEKSHENYQYILTSHNYILEP